MATHKGSLQRSAGQGLIWGVGFTLGRDIIQFAATLVLVRLLSPQIYGQFALAQTIQLALAAASFKAVAPFALQSRDPDNFDWNNHYSAAVVLNISAFVITLLIAAALYAVGGTSLRYVAAVLAILSPTFLMEIIGTNYFVWLQANHKWRRMRTLLIGGAVLASVGAILLALWGAGIFSLAFGSMLLVLPLLIDYVVRRPFSLRFQRDWYRKYKEGIQFGLNRTAAGGVTSGAALVEQGVLSAAFGFSTLGLYTRAVGLAQITSGRIGPLLMQTLYPVLTRAEASSDRFRRFAATLYQGVLWVSLPAAAFLALESERLVSLLYGEKWSSVAPFLPAAAALLALRGLYQMFNLVLLANLQQSVCLRLDLIMSLSSIPLIVAAAFFGPQFLLYALCVHGVALFGLAARAGIKGGAIALGDVVSPAAICAAALTVGVVVHAIAVGPLSSALTRYPDVAVLGVSALLFAVAYVGSLRIASPTAFFNLLATVPLPHRLEHALQIVTFAPARFRSRGNVP